MSKYATILIILSIIIGCYAEPRQNSIEKSNNQSIKKDNTTVVNNTPESNEVKSLDKKFGKLKVSFEQFEFHHNNNIYYVIDNNDLIKDFVEKQRLKSNSYQITQDICLLGDIIDKSANGGNSFGHMGGYGMAIIVQEFC